MADNGNVTFLRPRNTAPPGLPPLPQSTPPEPSAPPPAIAPSSGADVVPGSNRPSPSASLAAIPVTLPPTPGHVPATFQSGGLDDDENAEEIGMGALGLAAVLAVALAALRGTAGALTDWRQRRLERATEAEPLRAARLKLAEARARTEQSTLGSDSGRKKVPSSQEYGQRTLNRGGGSGGGGRSGGGSSPGGGRGGRGPGSSGSGGTSNASGAGGGPGRKNKAHGPGTGGGAGLQLTPSPKKHRKHDKGGGGSGSGGTSSGGHRGRDGAGKGPGAKHKGAGGGPGSSGGGRGERGAGGKKPGTLGQLALERSRRRTEKQRAADQRADRQQKADLKKKPQDGDGGFTADKDRPQNTPRPLRKDKHASKDRHKGKGRRVTLTQAMVDEAARRAFDRLKKRRERIFPFIHRVPTEGGAAAADTGASTKEDTTPPPGKPGTDAKTPPSSGQTPPGPAADETTAKGPDWEWYEPPGGGGRRNAWDSLFEATVAAEVIWTVEQDGPPVSHATRREPAALGYNPSPAPAPAAPAGGTTTLTKEASVSGLIPMPGQRAAAQHLTEVTLDDVLVQLAMSKERCFATYDETAVLADKARKLRDALAELGTELAEVHNVIGQATAHAMERLAESMDVLARKADEMRSKSMGAAESVEVVHDSMHDAYKPVQMAAADAGLAMPSARIHNED
ncbi:hypothetical protein [Streptomyces griseoluteus]|uniref:hypothetical protein n=1 Tax=Streptomyces griseoluteus TaxID=29306 RepID=UPI0033197873